MNLTTHFNRYGAPVMLPSFRRMGVYRPVYQPGAFAYPANGLMGTDPQDDLKHAVINAGYLLSGNPDTPQVEVVARLRDGTSMGLRGRWIADRDVLHLVRHYLWQKFWHEKHPVGPYEVPRWKPPPLPDAFGPPGEQLEYAPVE